ncbi:class I SAM-dependent methyltransferase [Frateuria soli]|uniref:class I SAM-dependent methyltransferase n=1 Tax=Frateuria soli TaxID=1542730 RepID=UPI001E5AECFF|nr:class I SAM-dependent methyltransferase [Frateuria soli]UGB37564.1 class I SAM-dependent methyltransferase [Frateuria soli]
MENLRLLGPAAPEQGWVPAPRYLLRRNRVMHALAAIVPCQVLEIGCGTGLLLHELADRGFACTGLETSRAAQELATRLAEQAGRPIHFHAEPAPDWRQRFGLLMALEVLEHIEDDLGALRQWRAWAAPGARLLLSVPAHQTRWNARDVWAGHVRRYERQQLAGLFQAAGFAVERIECYGFPLANLLERAAARRYAGKHRERSPPGQDSRDANTAQSGIDRTSEVKWYPLLRSLPGRALLAAAIQAQRPFLSTEAGNGYLALARVP